MNNIRVGTCGYGYYKPRGDWKQKYKSKLQAYSEAFKVVELNRTRTGTTGRKTDPPGGESRDCVLHV